ncbi:MAG: Holliday junction resolvase RuvX [Bdellovibrionaceae bacterium]|nr:Holliday junction resolvase RuvX [Bdellovibrionales bacterium]MCB9254907.1 Holliday junction resolvase RuvX [Pseudobdellovibrionaceae bacterium]
MERILALDVGTKRTGAAISDESHTFSFPLLQFEATDPRRWVENVVELIDENDVGTLVVGMPLDSSGEPSEMGLEIRKRVALLQKRKSLPIIEWDERLTSAQAERYLIEGEVSRKKRKQVVDKVAATILLQSYLDSLQFDHAPWN